MLDATGGNPVPKDMSSLAIEGTFPPNSTEAITSFVPTSTEQQNLHAATIFKTHLDDISIATHPLDDKQLVAHFQMVLAACENSVDQLVRSQSCYALFPALANSLLDCWTYFCGRARGACRARPCGFRDLPYSQSSDPTH